MSCRLEMDRTSLFRGFVDILREISGITSNEQRNHFTTVSAIPISQTFRSSECLQDYFRHLRLDGRDGSRFDCAPADRRRDRAGTTDYRNDLCDAAGADLHHVAVVDRSLRVCAAADGGHDVFVG